MRFVDRNDAGRRLGAALAHLRQESPVVVGLPRGGVPVADQVARALDAPLDVLLVRKLGLPHHPELAMGAIGEGGVEVLDESTVRLAHVSARQLEEVERRERAELQRRAELYRPDGRTPLDGRTVIVVDDGFATGSTALAACAVARAQGARRVVLAVPVAPSDWAERVGDAADELVALDTPARFGAVGQFYVDFSPTSDDEVVERLRRARRDHLGATIDLTGNFDAEVAIDVGGIALGGHLRIPEGARAVVVFAHGSGSSRHSPRNRAVADVLHRAGFGTLLIDLLTDAEARVRSNVFDVTRLAARLVAVTRWLSTQPRAAGLEVGYFGASTGAGAALVAAAHPATDVRAVVSRGGRPDLAGPHLPDVHAPTLLIVGSRDTEVLELNRRAQRRLRCPNELTIVPGATHLFEEPGALEEVAADAARWFALHLSRAPSTH